MMSTYADEILALIKADIDSGVVCRLAHMCKDATIVPRTKVTKPSQPEIPSMPTDAESKMLCHVLVRATHDLQTNQQKTRAQTQVFLNNDCQKLPNTQLIEKVTKIRSSSGIMILSSSVSNTGSTAWN
jgi:hypothetical protein